MHSAFHEIDQGATFTLKFIGESIRPQKLDWLNAKTATQWSAILRIKTPLGRIYFGAEDPKIRCTLQVIDGNGEETTEILEDCKYLFPHDIFENCRDLDEILSAERALDRPKKRPKSTSSKVFQA